MPSMRFQGKDLNLVFTDDNVGENLIIHTEKQNYDAWGIVRVNFSITNQSGVDQMVKYSISLPDHPHWRMRYIMRSIGEESIVIPARPTFKVRNGIITQTGIALPETKIRNLWKDLLLGGFTPKPGLQRKSVLDRKTVNESEGDMVRAGETVFYTATFYLGETPASGVEFFIEAFGNQGGYGHLDPTAFNGSDNFNSYSDGDLNTLNGGSGWSGAWSAATDHDIQGTVVFDGAKAVSAGATASQSQRTITTGQSEASIYIAMRRTDSSGGAFYFIISKDAGTDLGYVASEAVAGQVSIYDGAWTNIAAYTNAKWYLINVEWDDTAQPDKYRARINNDNGGWSAFSAWKAMLATFTTVNHIETQAASSGAATVWYDTIQGTEPSWPVVDLAISVNDAVTVTESVTLLMTSFINVNDSITVSESVSVLIVFNINVNDAITVTESVTVAIPNLGNISVNDTVTVSEAVTMLITSFVNVNDSITVSESISIVFINLISVNDSITVSESVTTAIPNLGGISVNDSITVTESISLGINLAGINVSDSITVSEALAFALNFNVSVSDAITVSESITVGLTSYISVNDSITVSESKTVNVIPPRSGLIIMRSKEQGYPLGMDRTEII